MKLWFVKINITKLTSKPKKQKTPPKVRFTGELFGEFPEKPKKEKKRSKNVRTTAPAVKKEKKKVAETIEFVKNILEDISAPLAKCIDMKIHRLYVIAAAKEAADTAVMFGHLNTAVGSLILACKKFRALDINIEKTGVYSNFNTEKSALDAEIELALSVKHIGITGFTALMSYLKYKK